MAFVCCESDPDAQGKAFGSLEFGRGVLAASLVTFINLMVSHSNPLMQSYSGVPESKVCFYVIFAFYILVNFSAAILCFALLKNKKPQEEKDEKTNSFDLERLKTVCFNPAVWCNLVIVICAYCSFKALDFYALMLKESFHFSKEYLLHFITVLAWARPLSAFLVGLLGDKLTASRACSLCFILIFLPTLGIYLYPPSVLGLPLFFSLIVLQLVGVFGLRGVYFALFGEGHVNQEDTALATGFISFLGFTPEFSLPILAVNLIDKNGLAGAQSFSLFILGLACVGFLATNVFKKFCSERAFS